MRRRIALTGALTIAGTALAGAPAHATQAHATGKTLSVTAASSWKCNYKNRNLHICIRRTANKRLQLKITYRGKYSGPVFAYFWGKEYYKGSKTLSKNLAVSSKTWKTVPSKKLPTFTCPKTAKYVQGDYTWSSTTALNTTPKIACR